MSFSNQETGNYGENLAVQYLENQGLKILERNYRSHYGEIDIIAIDQQCLCFVEVKTRSSHHYGSPIEAVHPRKQQRILRTAYCYIQESEDESPQRRFDIVTVDLSREWDPVIEYFPDAFEVRE
ncbi:MAG: YraN family protein [Candidatus Omnitrophica bacterium]|nr:YraN family protein [Candidatus Omnitrophota bacterium]